ncbi:Polycomb protein Asx [Araneus ventricosus]|uniref:Polycomb protein Asx n=1 Tax=Araneus ventricosus TaxID=182803 RepID=A0A4Y2AXT3_ARAVE|nr:Polycomb protein Asx [Araneus ventricosus]
MVISVSGKMQFELSKERQVRKKKVRTWTEAAKLALELYPKTPMGHKDIFNIIRAKGLKDVSGPASLACLNAMLHVHSRGPEAMFYRVDGCTSVFGLASNIPEGGVKMEVDEDESGQDFDPGDSDQDSGASLSPGRKKDRVLYVRLPPGYKNFTSLNSNSLCNHQTDESLLHKADQLTVKPLTYKNEYYTRVRRINGENIEDPKKEKCNQSSAANLPVSSPSKVSQSHSQRAIKHALRQQQKRRRRNTAIAASGNAPPPIPRIIMKSLPPAPAGAGCVPEERWRCSLEKTSLRESTRHKPQTMRELLASIPGLSFKPRKRCNRKLSTAAQIAQTKKGCINIETPDSILVNTNLRALLNKHTFASLPPVYQYRLVQLLPQADRIIGSDYSVRLTATALSNEFFARACQEWKRRLQEGEFTPENQMKLKGEAERDHSKLDPWKIHNFEPVWGYNSMSEFPDQNKSSPFLINSQLKSSLNTQPKHVPTIKIKPVVRKCRLNSSLSKHRHLPDQDSPSHSDENHPSVDSPLYNEASDVDTLIIEESNENLYVPPSKKLKVSETISSNSSESPESSEESLQTITQHSPCPSPCPSSVTSMPSPSHSIEEADSPKETVCADSSVIPISLSVTVVQTTAPSQSLVPPITIRSIPVIRSGSSKKNSGRSDGSVNLERSYQICKESNNKKEPTPAVTEGSTELQACDAASMVTSSVTTSGISMLNESVSDSTENSVVKSDTTNVESNNVNMQEVPSSSNQLLLTTCLPTTVPTFALNSVSSTINLLETSNTCSNAEVSSLESMGENPEIDKMEEAETQFNLNLPVRMAADSTSVEEPEAFSAESPLPAELADASPSLVASPAPSSEDLKDPSPVEEDTTVEDPESSSSMNITDPDYSPLVKDETSDDSNENSATPSEHVTSRDSASFNSNCEIAETNVVSSSLQKDTSCLPSDCLDSDSSSLQQSFNNSQVVDEDSTIILSLPSSEVENVIPDDLTVTEESIPEKEILIDDGNSNSSTADNSSVSCAVSQPSPTESKDTSFDIESAQEKANVELPSTETEHSPSSCDKTQCEEISTYSAEPYSNESVVKHFDPPSRPLSAPSNFTPVHVSSSVEVSSLKRPASCQSYYRSSKVTPIVYFDSPESDDAKSDCDKGENVPTSSPLSSDSVVPFASSLCNEESSNSSAKTEHLVAERVSNSENLSPQPAVVNKDLPSDKTVPLTTGCPRSSPIARAASTPSSAPSMQSPTPITRPLSNPIPETSIHHPLNKQCNSDYQNYPPVTNHLSLPEGCTGGSGGSLPSQAVSVVPATTQLPIASGGVMFPSANGLASTVGTPAGDTPPRSLLQSSPVINGASSGIEGAVTSTGGDSGGSSGSGSTGNDNNCACNLKAMVMCLKCGAFCHDDCIGPSRLCVTCLIR